MIDYEIISRASEDTLDQQISLTELRCYSLPFGLLGFISHFLTYATIVCLWYGRKPLWPFKKIHNTKFDLALGFIGLCVCIVMSLFTIINCKNTWQLLVIAVWKLSMSLLNGLTALHVAILTVEKGEEDSEAEAVEIVKTKNAAWWILLYIPGMAAGMAGLMNLVVKTARFLPDLLRLTIAFYFIVGAAFIVGIITMIVICCKGRRAPAKVGATGFVVSVCFFLTLSAFYSDWCLGIIMDNLLGIPSGDHSGFYWTYFIAKRLTMFSW